MSLAHVLSEAGYTPERLETHARLTFEVTEKALRIQSMSLDLDARIPGIERTTFLELAAKASKTCTISVVLNTEITVNFRLLN